MESPPRCLTFSLNAERGGEAALLHKVVVTRLDRHTVPGPALQARQRHQVGLAAQVVYSRGLRMEKRTMRDQRAIRYRKCFSTMSQTLQRRQETDRRHEARKKKKKEQRGCVPEDDAPA